MRAHQRDGTNRKGSNNKPNARGIGYCEMAMSTFDRKLDGFGAIFGVALLGGAACSFLDCWQRKKKPRRVSSATPLAGRWDISPCTRCSTFSAMTAGRGPAEGPDASPGRGHFERARTPPDGGLRAEPHISNLGRCFNWQDYLIMFKPKASPFRLTATSTRRISASM